MADVLGAPDVDLVVLVLGGLAVDGVVEVHALGVLPPPVAPDQVAARAEQAHDHCSNDRNCMRLTHSHRHGATLNSGTARGGSGAHTHSVHNVVPPPVPPRVSGPPDAPAFRGTRSYARFSGAGLQTHPSREMSTQRRNSSKTVPNYSFVRLSEGPKHVLFWSHASILLP